MAMRASAREAAETGVQGRGPREVMLRNLGLTQTKGRDSARRRRTPEERFAADNTHGAGVIGSPTPYNGLFRSKLDWASE